MSTLTEYQAGGATTSLKRGTTSRSLGAAPIVATAPANPGKNAAQQVVNKVGSIAGQSLDIARSVAGAAGRFVVNSAKDINRAGESSKDTIADLITYPIRSSFNEQKSKVLREKQREVQDAYSAGKMSKQDYQFAIKDINKGYEEVNRSANQIATSRGTKQRMEDIASTTATVLSLGDLSLLEVGGKQALQAGGKEAIRATIDEGATTLEKLFMRIPSVRGLVERNIEKMGVREAQRLAGESTAQFLAREGKTVATDLLIKRPIFYQSNVGQAESLYKNIIKGDYKAGATDAAWLGVQMLNGGPLGAAGKLLGYGKSLGGKIAYGKGSFIDELSTRIGNKDSGQIAQYLLKNKEISPEFGKELEKTFRIFQESNLRNAGENVPTAVDNFLRTYVDSNVNLESLTPQQIYRDMKNWQEADTVWNAALKAGKIRNMTVEEGARYTPVRWDATVRNSVAQAIRDAGDGAQAQQDAVNALTDKPGVGFGNNNNLMLLINKVIGEGGGAAEVARKIQAIDAALTTPNYLPKQLTKRLAELGYTIAEPVGGRKTPHLELDDTRKLVSAAMEGSEMFDPSIQPAPVVSNVAQFFEKAGLSPQDANPAAYRKLSESVTANLDKTLVASSLGLNRAGDKVSGGQAVLSRLQQFIENKKAVPIIGRVSAGQSSLTDIRQMTLNEIKSALDSKTTRITTQEAKEVRKAILEGYRQVPLELRGMGDRIVDDLYRFNPLQKYYSRIQGALRYTYNPFFRSQELVETKMLSHATANNLIWGKSRAELNAVAQTLEDARIFSGALVGEGSNDQVLGRITANMTKAQKRDLAGLALDVAKTQGKTVEQLAKDNPEILDDALRVIVQYPKKGVLSSPLARTLNLVFFPIRYNAKVTMVAAQALAKQPPSIQKAVLHSLFNLKDWLKSPEGIKWQSQHADAIQLFNWITPVNSIESTFKLLHPNSVADVGQLGGLPLGLITQILDGQGLINLNRPYVEPKTGDVFPRYIPETLKGRASNALADLLNTMFTYPGRTLGLPGKSQTIRDLVGSVIETNGSDFAKKIETDRLTPLQQKWVQVLQGDTSQETIDSLYHSPAPGQFPWYTLPPMTIPGNPKAPALPARRTGLPHKAPKGKKEKTKALPPSAFGI